LSSHAGSRTNELGPTSVAITLRPRPTSAIATCPSPAPMSAADLAPAGTASATARCREASRGGRSLDDGEDLALLDHLLLADPDLLDRPRDRGRHGDLHLHRLQDQQDVVFLDPIARGRLHLPHVAHQLGPDLSHPLPPALYGRPRPAPWPS